MISSTGTMHKSTVTCHLHCYMTESDQKERVETTAATTKMERKMRSRPKVTAPNVFRVCIDASPSYDRIQIDYNIHKLMYKYFYLRRSLILLRSWPSTPNDVGADSDWSKCFISAISVSAVGIPPDGVRPDIRMRTGVILRFLRRK